MAWSWNRQVPRLQQQHGKRTQSQHHMPVATWELARACLRDTLVAHPNGIDLSSLKPGFKTRYRIELQQYRFGYSKLSEFIQDQDFHDICWVHWEGNKCTVLPSWSWEDEQTTKQSGADNVLPSNSMDLNADVNVPGAQGADHFKGTQDANGISGASPLSSGMNVDNEVAQSYELLGLPSLSDVCLAGLSEVHQESVQASKNNPEGFSVADNSSLGPMVILLSMWVWQHAVCRSARWSTSQVVEDDNVISKRRHITYTAMWKDSARVPIAQGACKMHMSSEGPMDPPNACSIGGLGFMLIYLTICTWHQFVEWVQSYRSIGQSSPAEESSVPKSDALNHKLAQQAKIACRLRWKWASGRVVAELHRKRARSVQKKLNNLCEDIAELCTDPLTYKLMDKPVLAADLHTYDMVSIETWHLQNGGGPSVSSPFTRAPMEMLTLRVNTTAVGLLQIHQKLSVDKAQGVNRKAADLLPERVNAGLVNAIRTRQEDLALELLARPIDDDYLNNFYRLDGAQYSLLQLALSCHLPRAAKAVVARRDFRRVLHPSSNGLLAIHMATALGYLEVCRAILEETGAEVLSSYPLAQATLRLENGQMVAVDQTTSCWTIARREQHTALLSTFHEFTARQAQ